jgi:hypothetical protein
MPEGVGAATAADGFVDCACDTEFPQQRIARRVDGTKTSRTAIRIGEMNFIWCR